MFDEDEAKMVEICTRRETKLTNKKHRLQRFMLKTLTGRAPMIGSTAISEA